MQKSCTVDHLHPAKQNLSFIHEAKVTRPPSLYGTSEDDALTEFLIIAVGKTALTKQMDT